MSISFLFWTHFYNFHIRLFRLQPPGLWHRSILQIDTNRYKCFRGACCRRLECKWFPGVLNVEQYGLLKWNVLPCLAIRVDIKILQPPWRHIRECTYSTIYSYPRQQKMSYQFHSPIALPLEWRPQYPFNRRLDGPQSRYAGFGGEKNLLFPREIKPQSLYWPTRSLVTILRYSALLELPNCH